MALTYGFYNAELVNGSYDRTYDAEDFGAMFDGLISDGVFPTYGKQFKVTKYAELKVKVNTGKAWLNGTWTILDKAIAVSVDTHYGDYIAGQQEAEDQLNIRNGCRQQGVAYKQ